MRYSWLVVLFAGLLMACGDKKPKFPNCGSDKDCKDGQHCFQKTCSACSTDEHCENWESCNGGACLPKDGRCGDKSDCLSGQICKKNTCTSCESDAECGDDSRCSNGACLVRGACKVDEDCADDEDCIDGQCKRPGRDTPPELSCNLESVYFGFDEFTVNEEARPSLQSASECMQKAPERNVFVQGHTDSAGTAEYNIALSEKRGRSVADFLSRLGIDPVRLRVIPKGENEASATDEESRAQERRVDFEWQ